jgi:hypothetical protein
MGLRALLALALLVVACDDTMQSGPPPDLSTSGCAPYTAPGAIQPSGPCTPGQSCHEFELSCGCCSSNNQWGCAGPPGRDGGINPTHC